MVKMSYIGLMKSSNTIKRLLYMLLLAVFSTVITTSASSCKTKEGCGLEDQYKADLSTKKRGKSNLFSKKQRKKIRR